MSEIGVGVVIGLLIGLFFGGLITSLCTSSNLAGWKLIVRCSNCGNDNIVADPENDMEGDTCQKCDDNSPVVYGLKNSDGRIIIPWPKDKKNKDNFKPFRCKYCGAPNFEEDK